MMKMLVNTLVNLKDVGGMRMKTLKRTLVVAFFLLVAARAEAQLVTADVLLYNTGSCTWESGSGSPEGAVTASGCAYWIQTDTPFDLWRKASGTGNTGWIKMTTGTGPVGTVTSVGLVLPSIFTVSGSPVTTSGTLTGTLATQTANLVFAGPTSGGAATPTFRALVKADQVSVTAYTDVTNTFTAKQIVSGAFGAAAFGIDLNETGTDDVAYRIRRASGTTALWELKIPSGSTDFQLYSSGARFTISPAGLATAVIFNGTTGFQVNSGAAIGTILRGNGTNYTDSTSTYPDTVTVNRLLYASTTNVVSDLATANSGVLVTSGAGVPSIATDIPTAVTLGGAYVYRVGGTDVLVTDGGTGVSTIASNGIPYGQGTSAIAVATAAASSVLVTSGASVPSLSTDLPTAITIGGAYVYRVGGTDVALADGGTNASLTPVNGGLAYSTASALALGAAGSANDVARSGGAGAPTWTAPAALTRADDTNITLTLGGSPTTALLAATSITAGWTGTLAAARLNANVVQSVVNDTNVTGSIAAQALTIGWTGQLAVARGGTGAATFTLNGVLYGNGTSAIQVTTQGPTNSVLTASAGAPAFSATPTVTDLTTTDDVLVGDDLDVTDTANFNGVAPIVRFDASSFTLRAPSATRYGFRAFVEPWSGVTWMDVYDTTGDVYMPLKLRTSAFTVNAPLTVNGTTTLAGNLLPDVGYIRNIGSLTAKFLTVNAAELLVETLVAADTTATIGGRINVAPTTYLTVDLAAVDLTVTVKHNQMAAGDIIRMEANGAVEFLKVLAGPTGSAGLYIYNVQRNLDGTGANAWASGDALLNTGTTNDGFIDLYSMSGVFSGTGPTIVGNVRTGTGYSDIAARWGIGNVNGLCGYAADTYGAFFGDCNATNVTIDATNGFRIRHGTTNKWVADTNGNQSLVGDLTIGTSGSFRSGATAFATGTGIWMDYNGGTPRWRVGNPAGNQASWDGTTLTITGVVNVSAGGTIGGFEIGADYVRDVANTFGLASTVSGSDDVRFWAGATFANRATAPARVTEAGVATFTSGTIGGWTLATTTLTGTNAILSNTGVLTLGTGNDVAIVSAADGTYRLWIGNTAAGSAAFTVTKGGIMTATGAVISGTLTATSGTIGGFILAANLLSSGTDADYVAMSSGLTNAFWAGDSTFADAEFSVTAAGVLKATSATITGSITATTGAIGGFDIGTDYLRDVANSFGLASTVTGGDDVRFWAGATFANRATALARITEAGVATFGSLTIDSTGVKEAASTTQNTLAGLNLNGAYGFSVSNGAMGVFGANYTDGGSDYRILDIVSYVNSGEYATRVATLSLTAARNYASGGVGTITITTPTATSSAIDLTATTIALSGTVGTINGQTISSVASFSGSLTAVTTIRANTGFNINGTAGMTRVCDGTAGGITFVGGIMTTCTSVESAQSAVWLELRELRAEIARLNSIIGGRR